MELKDLRILAELLVVVVVLIDLSGGVESIKAAVGRWLGIKGDFRLKPIDCSLCMYHWTALVVMLCLGRLSLTCYMAICLGAVLTVPVKILLMTIIDALSALFEIWKR